MEDIFLRITSVLRLKEQCTKYEDSITVEKQPKAAPDAEHLNQNLSSHPSVSFTSTRSPFRCSDPEKTPNGTKNCLLFPSFLQFTHRGTGSGRVLTHTAASRWG